EVRERVARAERALRPERLRATLGHAARLLAQLEGRLRHAAAGETVRRRRAVQALAGRLESLSPLACLARGYSICTLPSGEIVTRARQVAPGAAVSVRLGEGSLGCRVEEVRGPESDRPAGDETHGGG